MLRTASVVRSRPTPPRTASDAQLPQALRATICSTQSWDPLHNSSRVRVGRIGMGCKADFAGNSTAIGKKFNAADRPSPSCHGPRGVVQRVPVAAAQTWLSLKQARLCRSASLPPDSEISVLQGCGRRAPDAMRGCGLSGVNACKVGQPAKSRGRCRCQRWFSLAVNLQTLTWCQYSGAASHHLALEARFCSNPRWS